MWGSIVGTAAFGRPPGRARLHWGREETRAVR